MNCDDNIGNNILLNSRKPLSLVFVMVCIYIFLVIERPWESIRFLNEVPIERIFALAMIFCALLSGKFKIVDSPMNKWVYGLLALHFILAPFAFNSGYALDQGVEYAKMVVLYLLMLAVVDDEKSLKVLVKVYAFSMMVYVMHSLWEYHNGRHDFKMGITRMLGVDSTFNDPNTFGASVVLSLPFVYALMRSESNKLFRYCYYSYFIMALICIVLTGSRSSSMALVFLLLLWAAIQKGKKKVLIFFGVVMAIALIWNGMPDDKRDRIRTLWNKDVGSGGAHMSAEGRLIGWQVSWKMFKREPFTGVGAGGKNFIGYRMANNIDEPGQESPTESHVLYGEILAELGMFGMAIFCGLVLTILKSTSSLMMRFNTLICNAFSSRLCAAIIACLLLLLFLGLGGHNFYRPLWLWLAAWTGSLLRILPSTNLCIRQAET